MTLDIKVASEHSTSRASKWLEVVNWPSCLRSRLAHTAKVSKLDFRRGHVIAAALSLIGNFWRWRPSLAVKKSISIVSVEKNSLWTLLPFTWYWGGGTALAGYGVFGMGSSSPSLVSAHVADANSTGI
jgi:hypothetical protein